MSVSGVGHGSQKCEYDCKLPVAIRPKGGRGSSLANLTIPAVYNSEMPDLLGKMALKRNRAVWDFSTDELHFLGPGDYDLRKAFPPGTDTYQLETAPSGHSVLPCCEYSQTEANPGNTLVLVSRASSSGTSRVPPPPSEPPALPASATRHEEIAPPPAA